MTNKTYTVSTKIVLIVLLAMAAVAAVSVIAFASFNRLNDDFEEMKTRHIAAKMMTLSINRDINYVSRLTRNIMLGSDYDREIVMLDERIQSIKGHFDELHNVTRGNKEAVLVQKAQTAALHFVEESYRYMEELVDVIPEERYRKYADYAMFATPLANESRKYFQKLIVRIDTNFEMSLQNFQSDIAHSKVVTVTAFIVIGIMLIFSSIVIMRSINRPIKTVISALNESSSLVNTVAKEVARSSRKLADGSLQQASVAEESAKSLKNMSEMTRYTAQNAADTDAHAKETKAVIEVLNRSMTLLTEAIREIAAESRQSQKIIKSIDDIASQTNLLAINAAVEAAHAGEESSGFAVVAKEVRVLALRAAEAAKITESILQETVLKAGQGEALVLKTEKEFDEVVKHASEVGQLVGEIATATEQQAAGINAVVEGISHMETIIRQNSASATDSLSISDDLYAAAESLHEYVENLTLLVGNAKRGKKE